MYSGYKSSFFKRIVSASGSLWYPNFLEYVMNNEINDNIEKIYFSLGNQESKTKNKIMMTVENNTKLIYSFLSQNISTIYEENIGTHFQNTINRMAKGIKIILE